MISALSITTGVVQISPVNLFAANFTYSRPALITAVSPVVKQK
jgi:hypothetical protein